MGRLPLLIVFLACLRTTFAQTAAQCDTSSYSAQAKAFLHWYRATYITEDTIVLTDSVITKSFPLAIFYYCLRDTINLTSQERAALLTLTDARPLTIWSTDLVGPAHIISMESLKPIFAKKVPDWDNFHRLYGQRLFSFAAPIFLRDNTLCIFYSGYYCGTLCGMGMTQLFKKIGDKWVFVQEEGGWAG
jgi:hypothetical protein